MTDLSDKLTVFVITCDGSVNYNTCISAINNQTCKFKLDIIKNYSPLSIAFQQMLDRCKTEYFIQIDDDMILNQNSVEKMYKFFEGNQSPTNISMDCYLLKDVHLQKNIYGVKIYKHWLFKKYPFDFSSPSCEVKQLNDMKQDGYDIRFKEEVMGEHSPHWTNEGIFERYFNLMSKFFLFRYQWMEKLPKQLMEMIKKDPSDKNIYAFAGALAGIYSDKIMNEEKDFRKKRKEYGRLQAFIEQPYQATLYMTSKCNHKCQFCFREHDEIEQAPDMTPEIVGKVLTKFPDIKGICVCGFGESLMSDNLIPVLQKLKSANKYVGIITNGSLITKRFNEICGWHQPDYISVSLNAHNQEEHEQTTGVKTWNSVIDGIKTVVNSPIECFVSSVVTLENIKHIPEFLKLVKGLGIKTVHLHNLLPHFASNGDNTYFWNNVLQEEHQYLIDDIKKLPESDIIKAYPVLISKNNSKSQCRFPFYSFAVNGSGSLSLCNSVLPCNKKYGNIDNFVIWNSEALQKFRDDFCDENLPHCKMCFRNFNMNF